jgi:hypothetical protein
MKQMAFCSMAPEDSHQCSLRVLPVFSNSPSSLHAAPVCLLFQLQQSSVVQHCGVLDLHLYYSLIIVQAAAEGACQ